MRPEDDMLRTMSLAVMLMAGVSTTLSAAQPSPPQPGNAARSNPYSRLFPTKSVAGTPVTTARPQAPPAAPQVKCGMTIIQGDASIDPGMLRSPADTSTRYTIRVFEPAVCK